MKAEAIRFLSTVGIFSLLDSTEIPGVLARLSTKDLAEGDLLFREGEEGTELFIVRTGGVRVSLKLPDGSEHEIARMGPGDFFGEMSIFDSAPRSASCRACSPTSLYSLSKEGFSALVARKPRTALKLMYRMLNVTTQRLRDTSGFVSDMVTWGESARRRAVTDELTGVYNRRFLEDSLDGYLAEAREKGRPLSLAMVDLDHFREINEAQRPGSGGRGAQEGREVVPLLPGRDGRRGALRRGRVPHHPSRRGLCPRQPRACRPCASRSPPRGRSRPRAAAHRQSPRASAWPAGPTTRPTCRA